jgi:hypothetical protein
MTTSSGPLGGHALHIAALLGPLVVVAVIGIVADVRAWSRRRGTRTASGRRVVIGVAVLSFTTAVIHAAVCPEHVREAALYGGFFAASALLQGIWPLLVLVRPDRRVLVAGAAGNLAVVVLWLVTRTVGIPLGPEAGEVEALGALDVIATAAEIGVVALCIRMLLNHSAVRETRDPVSGPVVAGAARP